MNTSKIFFKFKDITPETNPFSGVIMVSELVSKKQISEFNLLSRNVVLFEEECELELSAPKLEKNNILIIDEDYFSDPEIALSFCMQTRKNGIDGNLIVLISSSLRDLDLSPIEMNYCDAIVTNGVNAMDKVNSSIKAAYYLWVNRYLKSLEPNIIFKTAR